MNWYKSTDKWWEENIKDQVHVFDDVIHRDYQEEIKYFLMGGDDRSFPWYFIPDITGGNYGINLQKRAAFSHVLVGDDPLYCSEQNKQFMNLVKESCSKVNKEKSKVIQARSFLQLPLGIESTDPDSPHIDTEENHFVVLYYVLDSDGDTIIYNEQEESETYTIKERVTPKQGRVVIFDGRFYHTAEQPRHNPRCVINYDLL